MPRQSPYRIILSEEERTELDRRANKYTLPYFMAARAKMILFAAQGLDNDEIAIRVNTPRKVVSMWQKRFFEERLSELDERPRPGRPPVFPPRTGHPR